ncbi:MAG: hypothetical protein ABEL76_12490, partial [Bradymonadaceae bacterium]
QREGAESTAAIRSAPVDGGGAEPALDEFVQEIPAAVASGAELSDAMHRWIGRAVERLGDAPKWWSSPPRSRAVRSLLLLDAVRQRPPPRDALVELFRSAGVMDPATASTTAPELGVEGMPWAGYHDLLWSLYLREGAPADFPVESETLTSMTSAERLLGFLRAGEASRDTDILVDAVEHFVRLELASDSDFDHRDFLYRLASRKPSEGFVREFAERTSGRTYPRTDDSVVELERELDQLAGEIAAEAEVEADPVGDCRWFPELGGVRRRLAEIARLDDTAAAVAAFADQLDPRIPDPESHARGLVDIVDRSAGASGRVLLDSSEPEMDVAVDDLVEAVSADLRVLRESAETMFQSGTGDVSDVHRAGRKAVGRLEAIERRLVPCIAEFDAELLAAVVDELRDRIGVWLEVFERDVEGGLAEPEESGADAAEAIFERVLGGRTAELSDADQARLCRTAYAVVEAELGGALPPEDDAVEFADWRTQRGLLDAAARATDEEASPSPWMEFLAERWQRLADVAMSAQSEPSVIDLVADPDLRALRRCASDSASVEALEDWLMDRFQFGALAGLSAERRGKDGAGLGDYLRGAERTARNFTHVWLALMVGAVMILDFGDRRRRDLRLRPLRLDAEDAVSFRGRRGGRRSEPARPGARIRGRLFRLHRRGDLGPVVSLLGHRARLARCVRRPPHLGLDRICPLRRRLLRAVDGVGVTEGASRVVTDVRSATERLGPTSVDGARFRSGCVCPSTSPKAGR